MRCPTCGAENDAGDRFCAECGSQLPAAHATDPERSPEQQSTIPPQYSPPERDPNQAPVTATPSSDGDDADWRMSSLGPPPPPRRRTWLWVLIGIVGGLMLCCVAVGVFFTFTETGQNFVEEIEAEATRQAGGDPDAPATPAATPDATPATPATPAATPEATPVATPAPSGTPNALQESSIAGP